MQKFSFAAHSSNKLKGKGGSKLAKKIGCQITPPKTGLKVRRYHGIFYVCLLLQRYNFKDYQIPVPRYFLFVLCQPLINYLPLNPKLDRLKSFVALKTKKLPELSDGLSVT